MSDQERAAAKRRASFARSERRVKEASKTAAAQKVEAQRQAERDKADEQRKAEATKTAERRIAQARKKAEQRRLERHQANIRQQFTKTAADRKSQAARAAAQRVEEVRTAAEKKQTAVQDQKQRDAETYVAQQHKRQQAEQQAEHRRQTDRLRAEHKAERLGYRHKEAGGIIEHARQVRNVDIAERHELEAFDARRRSLTGRVVGLVRGGKHFAQQAQAIQDRHETARWQKHREHEARKDNQFWTEQAGRMRHGVERKDIAQRHQAETRELVQAQDRVRPEQVKDRIQVTEIVKSLGQEKPREKDRTTEARPAEAFTQAAGHERKR